MKTFEEIEHFVVTERARLTDKFTIGFARFYFNRFQNERSKIKSLLEIGVNRAGGCLFWREYLPNAEIHGIDVRPRITNYIENRLRMTVVDQSNREELKEFADANGPWDIIVDDGSHMVSHQVASFETLWPFVNNGGQYIIEDIQTSTRPDKFKLKYIDMDVHFVDYCKNIEKTKSLPYVDSIEFFENMVIFKKSGVL